MRAAIAYSVSAFVHVVAIGSLAICSAHSWSHHFQVAAGQPITVQFSPASPAAEPAAIRVIEAEEPLEPEQTEPAPKPVTVERQETVALTDHEPEPDIQVSELLPAATSSRRQQESEPEEATQMRATMVRWTPKADAAEADASAVEIQFQAAAQAGVAEELPRSLPSNPAPLYPADAVSARVEGRVVLRVFVTASGGVTSVTVDVSSGSTSLDESALAAIKRWRFAPARRGGSPIDYEIRVPVRFSIQGS